MPAPGSTPILIYNSSTASQVPLAANLSQGELAINVTDKKLYSKDSGGNVILIASSGGDVTGPATSTNLAIPTFSGTTGKLLLNNSGVTISSGVVSGTGFTGAHNGTLGATTPSTVVATDLTTTGNTILGNASTDTLNVGNGDLIKDASGNVGLGVTPSAWGNQGKTIQIGYGALSSPYFSTTNNQVILYNNAYQAQDTTFKYLLTTNKASCYVQIEGVHIWKTAAGGTAGNTISFTQAMTLDASGGLKTLNTIGVGNATPSTSGAGITFPATQSASTDANTLDDYEEGTWTPSVGGTATYTNRSGRYTKIGNVVSCFCLLQIASIGTGSTNTISGLPFTPTDRGYGGSMSYWSAISIGIVYLAPVFNGTGIGFIGTTSANANVTDGIAIFANSAYVMFGGTYATS